MCEYCGCQVISPIAQLQRRQIDDALEQAAAGAGSAEQFAAARAAPSPVGLLGATVELIDTR